MGGGGGLKNSAFEAQFPEEKPPEVVKQPTGIVFAGAGERRALKLKARGKEPLRK